MKLELCAIVFLCLADVLHAETKSQQSADTSLTDNGQRLGRRYAESTIASDISKIMDSVVQKNFVNFLLNQREKKNVPNVTPDNDPEFLMYSELLKKIAVCVHDPVDNVN